MKDKISNISKAELIKKEILDKVSEYYKATNDALNNEFKEGVSRIPYAGRVYDEEEMINLVDSSLEFWLTYGKYSKEFESKLSKFLNVKHSLLVNSGSSANLLAFMALTSPLLKERQIKRGDEVITVAACFPTTISPIIQYGAVPVFVDVELETINIDIKQLDMALSNKTKAVMLAHTLGNPFDVLKVKAFCEKHNLWLIEDNCDALGSKVGDRYTGTFGDIGTSSFYPPHHITMGEGGAVYTDNSLLRRLMLSFRDWGRDCWCESGVDNTCGKRFTQQFGKLPLGYDHKFVYSHFGYNLKATDMQAAVGAAQLDKLEQFIKKRKENYEILYKGLNHLSGKIIFPQPIEDGSPSWFGFFMLIKDNRSIARNDISTHLEKNHIQTRNLFAGNILKHPCFDTLIPDKEYRVIGDLKNTEKILNNGFWVGVYPGMSREKLEYIIKMIKEIIPD